MYMHVVCDRVSFTCTMEEPERVCCICSYDVYKKIWGAAFGKVMSCEREAHNAHDRYAVTVKVTGTTDIIGHLPTSLDTFVALIICCGKYFTSLIFVAI